MAIPRFLVLPSTLKGAGFGLFNASARVLLPGELLTFHPDPVIASEAQSYVNDSLYTVPNDYRRSRYLADSIMSSWQLLTTDKAQVRPVDRNNVEWDEKVRTFRAIKTIEPEEEILRSYNKYGILSGLALDILGSNYSNPNMPVLTLVERRRSWMSLSFLCRLLGIQMSLTRPLLEDKEWLDFNPATLAIRLQKDAKPVEFVVGRPLWASDDPAAIPSDLEAFAQQLAIFADFRQQRHLELNAILQANKLTADS